MNKPIVWGGLLLAVLFALLARWQGLSEAEASASSDAGAAHPWISPSIERAAAQADGQAAAASGPQASLAASSPDMAAPAAESMAYAREHGDDRTPPIDTTAQADAVPAATAWELSDPKRYQAYEQRQQQRVYAAYVQAAQEALPKWQTQLDQARQRGVPEQELAAGEEKIKKLQAMQASLQSQEPKAETHTASRPQ